MDFARHVANSPQSAEGHNSMSSCQFDRGPLVLKGKFCRWCAVALLAIGVCAAQGQAPSAAQPAPAAKPPASEAAPDASAQVPTLSSNTNEVTLDLVVKDKKHRPVLDLKAEDLVVTDNDVPVKLNGFHLVSGNAVAD